MNGLDSIRDTFARSRSEGRATFMPFFSAGFPNLDASLDAMSALVDAGADALEIGMPFSDPLADGPVIQHASQVALEGGTRIADCILVVQRLRARGVAIPLVMMGYLNPLLSFGLKRFVEEAAAAGANGFIVPDLPPEEAGEMLSLCEAHGLGFIPLVAPNSTAERVRQAASLARGFIYLVSVTGVTGARDSLPPDLADYVRRVRGLTDLPLAVGFGISRPEHARAVAGIADGIIVASALIRLMESEGLAAVRALAESLRAACVGEKTSLTP
jgi:tryptophan synthase alpha chain